MEILEGLEKEVNDQAEMLSNYDITTKEYTDGAKNFQIIHECLMKEKELELEKYKADINYDIEDRKVINDEKRIINEEEDLRLKKDNDKKSRRGDSVKTCIYVGGMLVSIVLSFAGSQSAIMDTKLVRNAESFLKNVIKL